VCEELEIKVSIDGKHIWISGRCLDFHQARALANKILGIIEYTQIWGNRNDRSKRNE